MKKPKEQIGIGTVEISPRAKGYVLDTLTKNRLSTGPYTRNFEALFARLHGRRHAIFCNSGTSALQVAVGVLKETYGWSQGEEILCPAITFIASANVILQNGLKPVFVDVEPNYYGVDPKKIEEKITKKTRAIMVVHLFGMPCQMDEIAKIATRHQLKIIEDACETPFAKFKGKPVGSWGEISCFSTYASHIIVTGVGGLAVTDKNNLAVKIKSAFNHGRDNIYLTMDDDKNASSGKLKMIVKKRFSFIHLGYSYRTTEMEAAIGLAQLEERKKILAERQRVAKRLIEGLTPIAHRLQLPQIRPGAEHVFMLFPLLIKDRRINRDKLIYFLEKQNIETRTMLPLLNQPIYKKLFGNIEKNYPVAKEINRQGFIIGCHQGITNDQVDFIVAQFLEYFKKNG